MWTPAVTHTHTPTGSYRVLTDNLSSTHNGADISCCLYICPTTVSWLRFYSVLLQLSPSQIKTSEEIISEAAQEAQLTGSLDIPVKKRPGLISNCALCE